MYKRKEGFLAFLFFLLLSFFLITLSRHGMLSFFKTPIEKLFSFTGRSFHNVLNFPFFKDSKIKELEEENKLFLSKYKDYEILKKENLALNDQFHSSSSKNFDLLKANVVGSAGKTLIIDKGMVDEIKAGQAVISGDMAVGKVTKVSRNISVVNLIINSSSFFRAMDLETNALGIIRGEGDSLMLSETLLSENLKVSDTIVTKGDIDEKGIGYPSNLIVGKIMAVDKNPSALFQSAKVKSVISFSKLSAVFVVLGLK